MTTRTEFSNNQVLNWSGPIWSTYHTTGMYHSRNSSGGDRSSEDFSNVPHNYNLELTTRIAGSLRRDMVNTVNGSGATEYTPDDGFPYTVRPWTQNDESILVATLANRIRESDFDAAVFAAELGKTTTLLVDKAVHLMNFVRELRRGNLTKALKLLTSATHNVKTRNKCLNKMIKYRLCIERNYKIGISPAKRNKHGKVLSKRFRSCVSPNCDYSADIAGQWLELQMAVKPLVSDIFALSETIDLWSQENKLRFKARRTLEGEILQTGVVTGRAGHVQTRKQYIAYVNSQFTASQKIGLRDPAVVIWELVPLSFLLDYLLPIGRYISGLSILNSTQAVYVETTTLKVRIYGTEELKVPKTGIVSYEWQYNTTPDTRPQYSHVSMQRLILNDLDVPSPRWQTPVSTGNAAVKFGNMLALAQKAFG